MPKKKKPAKQKKAVAKKAIKKPRKKTIAMPRKKAVKAKSAVKKAVLEEPVFLQPVPESKLVEWLSPQMQIDLKLQKHLDDLPKSYVLLAVIRVDEYSATNLELIKYFVKKKVPGVFVSINKPLEDIAQEVPKDYLDRDGIAFIDCISKMSGAGEIAGKDFYYIESPNDLVELSVMLEKLVTKISSEEKFVVIDSISTLLIYSKPDVVEKFVHSIAGKMRAWKAKCILIMVESAETRPIAETLGQFCDHTVEID